MNDSTPDISGLRRCACCNRPVRPGNTLVADWPGTVTMGSKGICGPCRLDERRAIAAARPVHKAADYGTPVTMPRVPSALEVRKARTRHNKAHIGRHVINGRACWWVGIPKAGVAYVGDWFTAVWLARYSNTLDADSRHALLVGAHSG